MNPYSKPVALLFTLALGCAPARSDNSGRTLYKLGPVSFGTLLESEVASGCGCAFRSPKQAEGIDYLLQWELEEPATMFVNGEVVRLKVETSSFYAKRIGEKSDIKLSSPTVSARGSMISTWVCPRKQESCELSRFKGQLSVQTPKGRAILPLVGYCGC